MDLGLKESVAVVVGGASGIGRAMARAFALAGASVVIVDVAPTVVEAAESLTAETSHPALGILADATDFAAMRKVLRLAQERFQRVDHVSYAAGVGSGKYGFPFWNLEPADWDRVLRVNLLGAVHVAHVFGPYLAEARRGTMLFISSVAGQMGSQTDPPYSAAKAALINFAQCAAKDLAPYDVRVNTICPGMIQTPLNRGVWQAWHDQQPPDQRLTYEAWADDKIRRVTPLGRWQQPDDVANMAVFLASPLAKNITGQTINVDGGQVMHW